MTMFAMMRAYTAVAGFRAFSTTICTAGARAGRASSGLLIVSRGTLVLRYAAGLGISGAKAAVAETGLDMNGAKAAVEETTRAAAS